jgi:hypothetical protein
MTRSRLAIFRPRPYLSIISRSDDVLPSLSLWFSTSSGISKRALPSRVERPFAFLFPAEDFTCRSGRSARRVFKRETEEKEEE